MQVQGFQLDRWEITEASTHGPAWLSSLQTEAVLLLNNYKCTAWYDPGHTCTNCGISVEGWGLWDRLRRCKHTHACLRLSLPLLCTNREQGRALASVTERTRTKVGVQPALPAVSVNTQKYKDPSAWCEPVTPKVRNRLSKVHYWERDGVQPAGTISVRPATFPDKLHTHATQSTFLFSYTVKIIRELWLVSMWIMFSHVVASKWLMGITSFETDPVLRLPQPWNGFQCNPC